MKYKITCGLLSLCILFTGCEYVNKFLHKSTTAETASQRPIKVEVLAIESMEQVAGQEYAGTLEESVSTALSFSTPGTVMKVNVAEGDYIKKGTVIATLDNSSANNALDIAKADYKRAKDGYDRVKSVYSGGAVSEVKMVEIETALEKAQSAYNIALKGVEDCTLKAPVDGYVGNLEIKVGQNVLPGVTVMSLMDINNMYATIAVAEDKISQIRIGAKVMVEINTLGTKIQGVVEQKSIKANSVLHTYSVKIALQNKGDVKLMPGMLCRVKFLESMNGQVVLPPECVLLHLDNSKFVWVVDSGKAYMRDVEVGEYLSTGIVINSGLAFGDSVIVKGYQKVSTGREVNE